jgi:hypothetical protein
MLMEDGAPRKAMEALYHFLLYLPDVSSVSFVILYNKLLNVFP